MADVDTAMNDFDGELRLGFLIHDVSRLRRTLFDRWLAPLGVTRSQWWVLAFLSREDGRPQTDLAVDLDVGKVALGALVDRLEASGFVERRLDPSDRRVKRVFLTKQSKKLLETLREQNNAFNLVIHAGLPREAIDTTTQTLRAMKHNIIEAAKEAGTGTAAHAPAVERPKRAARTPRVAVPAQQS